MPTAKSKISKALQSLCTEKLKNKSDLYVNLAETTALIFHSKVIFKKHFWLKLFILKNKLHALKPLIPCGNIGSHILKQTYSFYEQVWLSKYDLFYHRSLKGYELIIRQNKPY